MTLEELKPMIEQHAPQSLLYVLAAMGAMVILGRAYVAMTPTKSDDEWLQQMEAKPVIGHVLKLLVYFSPVARKDEPKA